MLIASSLRKEAHFQIQLFLQPAALSYSSTSGISFQGSSVALPNLRRSIGYPFQVVFGNVKMVGDTVVKRRPEGL